MEELASALPIGGAPYTYLWVNFDLWIPEESTHSNTD